MTDHPADRIDPWQPVWFWLCQHILDTVQLEAVLKLINAARAADQGEHERLQALIDAFDSGQQAALTGQPPDANPTAISAARIGSSKPNETPPSRHSNR
jgi:hypothetical protein